MFKNGWTERAENMDICLSCCKNSHEIKDQIVYKKECPNCGKVYETIYSDKKYCTKLCRTKAMTKRKPPKIPKEYTKICKECGEKFIAKHGLELYCSLNCRNKHNNRYHELKRRKKIKENGKIDWSISLLKLAKRDKNICHICGQKVNMKLDSNDINYGSIDHVCPINKGGTHTWDNVMLAHRGCNTLKGDKVLHYNHKG